MALAESEYKKKKTIVPKQSKKVSLKPEWMDKEIKEERASEEEISKLRSRMKRS